MQAKEIQIEQGSAEWLALRKNYIGSSDAAAIMGVSKWDTEYQAWCQKLDLVPPKEENGAMSRGKELEPIARELFEELVGMKMTPKVFVRDFMIASLDGWNDEHGMPLEIKCPNKDDHMLFLLGQVPAHYIPQLQHQMLVLDVPRMYYFSYHDHYDDGQPLIVPRDDAYCEKLLDKEKQFWNYYQTLEPPPLVDRDYVERTDEEWVKTTSELQQVQQQLKILEEKEDQLRQRTIELANGKNCKGNGVKATYYFKKGAVDWPEIPELKGVDLEKYRKPKIAVWRLGEI